MEVVQLIPGSGAATAPAPFIRASLERESSKVASDWMSAVVARCTSQNVIDPALVSWLKRGDLLQRCVFLASDGPNDPLKFRFIGTPSIRVMGRSWARRNLGRAVADNDGSDFGDAMAASYDEAIDGGGALYNRITLTGSLRDPVVYTHSLVGWRMPDGRRAVLSCVQL